MVFVSHLQFVLYFSCGLKGTCFSQLYKPVGYNLLYYKSLSFKKECESYN